MGILVRTASAILVVGLSVARAQPAGEPPPAASASPSPTILRYMADTQEFCDALRVKIDHAQTRRGTLPPDVAVLAREGEAMCRMGHFKPGIYRLRTALMMLRHQN